jgi:hypothetical protein
MPDLAFFRISTPVSFFPVHPSIPNFPYKMVSASIKLVLSMFGLAGLANAAVQCGLISSDDCGRNSHSFDHKLPTSVGSTFYADGFNGGTMNAKFQAESQSVSG